MLKRLAALVGLVLLLWGTSCAHKFNRDVREHDAQEDRTKWTTAATAERNERKTETADTNRRVTGRTVVKKPDGTVIDTTWVDEAVAKYTAQAAADSRSVSTAAGEQQRKNEHDRNAKTGSATSWWPPLWMWLAGAAVLSVLFWFWRWRAKRMRLL